MDSFYKNKPYIESEFQEAVFDGSTGLPPSEITDTICKMYADREENEPEELLRARIYAFILDNVQLCINEKTPFSVKLNLGVDYSYFASFDLSQNLLYRIRERVLSEKMPEGEKMRKLCSEIKLANCWVDFWHTVPDWNNVIKYGFSGILENTKAKKQEFISSGNLTNKNAVFYDSVIICFEAILRALNRIYEYSLKFSVPEFSSAVRNLMKNPPKSVYEVMLLQILFLYFEEIGYERGRTLGHVDRQFLPFYKNDLDSGRYTLDEIKEYFRYFFIHFTATKRYAQQPMALAGMDENGVSYVNEVTYLILDVYDEMNIYDPKIHFRHHKGIDKKLVLKVLDMIRRGNSSLCIFNDEVIFKCYEKMGIPPSDAANYVPLGCYEPIIHGKEEAEIGAVWMSLAKIFELTISRGVDILTGKKFAPEFSYKCDTFEDFFALFIRYLDYCVDFAIDNVEEQWQYATLVNPSPIYSATFTSCLERGLDVHENGAVYNNLSLKLFALATTVDSLYAIKKYVYDRRELTLDEMAECLRSNWQGKETLRARILRDSEKYGNNVESVDNIMVAVINHLRKKYAYKRISRGGVLRLGTDSITQFADFGKKTIATPDGRLTGDPLSKNLRSTDGCDKRGITALTSSILKIDATDFIDSATLDFILHPSAVSGEDGMCAFYGLVTDFLERGGIALQGNILYSKMLREAREHPEGYKTLQIRVCGWNEYFVNLSPELQEAFIRQCEGE